MFKYVGYVKRENEYNGKTYINYFPTILKTIDVNGYGYKPLMLWNKEKRCSYGIKLTPNEMEFFDLLNPQNVGKDCEVTFDEYGKICLRFI